MKGRNKQEEVCFGDKLSALTGRSILGAYAPAKCLLNPLLLAYSYPS